MASRQLCVFFKSFCKYMFLLTKSHKQKIFLIPTMIIHHQYHTDLNKLHVWLHLNVKTFKKFPNFLNQHARKKTFPSRGVWALPFVPRMTLTHSTVSMLCAPSWEKAFLKSSIAQKYQSISNLISTVQLSVCFNAKNHGDERGQLSKSTQKNK